jgi:hypothetical protein
LHIVTCASAPATRTPDLVVAKPLSRGAHPERRIARASTGSAAPTRAELGRACPDSHPSWRPPAMRVLSGFCIRVLHADSFPQDFTCDLRQDSPLETAANRSVPLACGPGVDQGRRLGSGRSTALSCVNCARSSVRHPRTCACGSC